MINYLKSTLQFILYTTLIYACYICSGVYHQKILKHQYAHRDTSAQQYFQMPIVFTLFPPLVCTIIGGIYLLFESCKEKQYQKAVIPRRKGSLDTQELLPQNSQKLTQKTKISLSDLKTDPQPSSQSKPIPALKALLCSTIININMWTYNKAVIQASFPAVVMVKSCSLLSVILVGIFCSRVQDKHLKLSLNKISIGLLVAVGIFVFNYFKEREEQGNNRPISWVSSILLVVSLMGDGFLPDVQAQIKAECRPGVMNMYFHINKFTFLIALGWTIISWQLVQMATFIYYHDQLQLDLLLFSVLNATGQLVIYRMVKLFKQHIPAFVIATRKCFTVLVNIFHFKHTLNQVQMMGMTLVFAAVICEVYQSYSQKVREEGESKGERVQAEEKEVKKEELIQCDQGVGDDSTMEEVL